MIKKNKIKSDEAIYRLKEICSRSEKSEHDIEKKLFEWGLENKSSQIIQNLKKEKFIDGRRYAKSFAADKMRFNKWGKFKIRMMLKSKNINDKEISEALSFIDSEEYRKMIFDELAKKRKSLREKDPYLIKNKIFTFGNQRGYESELINEFLDEVK